MNFLSHVAVTEPVRDRLVIAGSVLPDLLRYVGATGHREPAPETVFSDEAKRTVQGIRLHIESDAFFHHSPWFAQALKGVQDVMVRGGNPLAQHWSGGLLAHILIEIIIDAHVAENRPDLPAVLYESLEEFAGGACCREICARYTVDAERVRGIVAVLRANRRVETYNTTPGVADALRRVLKRDEREVLRLDEEPLLDAPIVWIRTRLRSGEDVIRTVREGIGLKA